LKLSAIFIESGNQQLFSSFVESKKPTVRAMGLACLVQTDTNAFESACNKLKDDKQKLIVWTGGCLPMEMTLGQLATARRVPKVTVTREGIGG
jgi:hypothetical protein